MSTPLSFEQYSVAVLIPCYNEGLTVADVVCQFRQQLPHAKIYVYDNNSTDHTIREAQNAGAIIRSEYQQGKGHVVRRMFADIESDIYVMVDGDCTYPANEVQTMIHTLVSKQLDMVVGARVPQDRAFRSQHETGNKLFNKAVSLLFSRGMNDIFSGYRAFSRRFVKSFPTQSKGFDIETEISVHALDLCLPYAEIPVSYIARPEGSFSKLNTYKDGIRILLKVMLLFKETKPMRLFGLITGLFLLLAIILGYPLIITFMATGSVPRIPTAMIVVGLLILATISMACGIILDGNAMARRENKKLHYLGLRALN